VDVAMRVFLGSGRLKETGLLLLTLGSSSIVVVTVTDPAPKAFWENSSEI